MSDSREKKLVEEIQHARRELFDLINNVDPGLSMSVGHLIPIDKLMDRYLLEALTENGPGSQTITVSSLEESLNDEVECLKADLEIAINRQQRYTDELEKLSKVMEDLSSTITASPAPATPIAKRMPQILANMTRRFGKEKENLKTILNCVLPEDPQGTITDLLARLLKNYFKEDSDEYLKVGENTTEAIQFLLQAHLIEIDPKDPLQIKLIDFS